MMASAVISGRRRKRNVSICSGRRETNLGTWELLLFLNHGYQHHTLTGSEAETDFLREKTLTNVFLLYLVLGTGSSKTIQGFGNLRDIVTTEANDRTSIARVSGFSLIRWKPSLLMCRPLPRKLSK